MRSFDARRSAARFSTATTPALLMESWRDKGPPAPLCQTQSPNTSATSTQSLSSLSPSCLTPRSTSTPTVSRNERSRSGGQGSENRDPASRRRHSDSSSASAILPPSPKRLKFISNDLDEQIEKAKKGTCGN